MVAIPQQTDGLPDGAREFLRTKLIQAVTHEGVVGTSDYAQFVIYPRITLISKDIVGGAQTNYALGIELTLNIGDFNGERIFATTTLTLKGVGTNETKAYIAAFRRIQPSLIGMQRFLKESKTKIITWYDAQFENILKEAKLLASQREYGHALFLLTSIPSSCQGYENAIKTTQQVWQQYVDFCCEVNIAKARSVWAAAQNANGAREAGEYLAMIYPDAHCYGEAQALYKEIKSKVKDDWDFVLKTWQDGVELESQRIDAARQVGVAYGKGQQPNTTNFIVK